LVILGSIMILGILGFSLYKSISEKAQFVNAHTTSTLMDMAALEMASVIYESIGAEIANTESDLFKKLVKATSTDFPVKVTGLDRKWSDLYTFSGKKEFAGLFSSADVRFDEYTPILATSSWQDPWEKRCNLNLTLEISLGRRPMRRLGKIYRFSRPCKIQSMSLPIISKFTLFIKNPEETNETNEGYNCYENFSDGKATQCSKVLPMIVFNTTEYRQLDLKKAGYIFLGGNKEIQLHVTSGGDEQNGEFFQFFNVNKAENQVPVFTITNTPNTAAFTKPYRLSDSPPQNANLAIQAALYGFYSLDSSDPPNDMNYKNTLEKYFSSSKSRSMKSSFLHLYGNITNPTPTLVVGKVARVFAQYSALTADLDNDGKHDGILVMLKAPAQYITDNGKSSGFWDLLRLPTIFKSKKKNLEIELFSTSLEKIFEKEDNYEQMASKLVLQDYNKVYDSLIDQSKKVPPQEHFKAKSYGEYMQTGEKFIINHDDGRSLYNGNLNKLMTNELLLNRVSLTVEDQEEFDTTFLKNANLDLQGQTIYVKKGPLQLPSKVVVVNPGIIAVNGDIKITGEIKRATDHDLLSLVAAGGGNILIEGTNEEIQAYLVALDGTIKPTKSNNKVTIKGGMTVGKLMPADWPSGAQLIYYPGFDPTRNTENNYSVIIGDYYEQWAVEACEPKIF